MLRYFEKIAILCLIVSCNLVQSSELCLGTCSVDDVTQEKTCVFKFSIDIFASDTGYFHVDGCDGVQPTLGMEHNVTYIFDQSNITNWYHPLGFAYGPDGVYGNNQELEKVSSNPVTGLDCSPNCDSPEYFLNDQPLCETDCDENFGLEEYEPWFARTRDDWSAEGNFSVKVKVTDPGTMEIFYFCHIHNFMSGRIKILDASLAPKNADDIVSIPYSYKVPADFDLDCGTYNVSQYANGAGCPDMTFVCGKNLNPYHQCLVALDCAMHVEMRTSNTRDKTTTFMHQMIAHHKNAVNMAKLLLKFNPDSILCGTVYDGRRLLDRRLGQLEMPKRKNRKLTECNTDGNSDGNTPVITMLWSIINGQNHQITFMESWLRDNNEPAYDYCPLSVSSDVEDTTSTPSSSSVAIPSIVLFVIPVIHKIMTY